MGEEDVLPMAKRPTRTQQPRCRLMKTVAITLMWFVFGMLISMAGSTLVDFKQLLHTDFNILGTVMVGRSVGYVIGCVLAGVLRDKTGIQSELIIAVTAAACALSIFVKPWSPSVPVFGALNVVEGLGTSSINTVSNAYLIRLWGDKAAVPVHVFHFGLGLGAFLGPLLTKNFLSVKCPSVDSNKNSTTNLHITTEDRFLKQGIRDWTCQNSTDSDPVTLQRSLLEIPLSIVGTLLALLSMVFFWFYLREKCSGDFQLGYMEPEEVVERPKIPSEKKSKFWFLQTFTFKFVVGLFFTYMCIISYETVVYSYIFTFAFEGDIGFSKSEASYLASAYWGTYTLGRLIASIVSHCVSVKVMIFVEMLGSLGSLMTLVFIGIRSKPWMWVSACLLGVFSAPVWPSGLAWADRYVTVKASVVAVTDVGAGIGGSVCMWVAGSLIESGKTHDYLVVAMSLCALGLVLITVLQVAGCRHGDRYLRKLNVNLVETYPLKDSSSGLIGLK